MARTKGPASADTKRRLADAALDQFHLKGYNGTSIQDLVSAAGAPKGTFYNHFASKEDLAVQVVRRYGEELGLTALTDPTTGSPLERLRRHFDGLISVGIEIAAERGCLIANLAGEAPAHSSAVASAVAHYLGAWVAALTGVLDEAEQAGELTTDIPAADLASFLVNAWEGGAVHAKTTASADPVHTFRRMLDRLLR